MAVAGLTAGLEDGWLSDFAVCEHLVGVGHPSVLPIYDDNTLLGVPTSLAPHVCLKSVGPLRLSTNPLCLISTPADLRPSCLIFDLRPSCLIFDLRPPAA